MITTHVNGRRKFGSYSEAVPNNPQRLVVEERVHSDGYIELKDRSKDIIISGGENISTIEVEDVLYHHPCVIEAAVVACPDPMWGETPCALVTPKPEATTTADDIIAFCREHLAHFKAPRTVFSNYCRRPRLAKSKNSWSANELEHPLTDPEKQGGNYAHLWTNYFPLL
jgi:long-subunit acyl-CoA synthetase (AMP-forming)